MWLCLRWVCRSQNGTAVWAEDYHATTGDAISAIAAAAINATIACADQSVALAANGAGWYSYNIHNIQWLIIDCGGGGGGGSGVCMMGNGIITVIIAIVIYNMNNIGSSSSSWSSTSRRVSSGSSRSSSSTTRSSSSSITVTVIITGLDAECFGWWKLMSWMMINI